MPCGVFSAAVVKRLSAEQAILGAPSGLDEKCVYMDLDRTKCLQQGVGIADVFDTLQAASQVKKLAFAEAVQTGGTIRVLVGGAEHIGAFKQATVRSQDGKDVPRVRWPRSRSWTALRRCIAST